MELRDVQSLQRALTILHEDHHVPNVVISSMPLREFLRRDLPPSLLSDVHNGASSPADDPSDDFLVCICSSRPAAAGAPDRLSTVHAHCLPCIPGYFSGVGDLFSALVLAHYDPHAARPPAQTPLSYAASEALTKTLAILRLTHAHARTLPADERTATDSEADAADPERLVRRMRGRELRLIQGQDVLRANPTPAKALRQMTCWEDFWAAR